MANARGSPSPLERKSLCLPSSEPGVALHSTDPAFASVLSQLYPSPESDAAEKLLLLKTELKRADTETFWRKLMEGMTEVCNAQYAFVAKRILVDDHDSAVEMPPIGEPGSCLMGVAFYYNDGKQQKAMHRDYKYFAWGAPCANMKHDKVFLVPERMSDFIRENPNPLPLVAEAYLGVPLFFDGKCFAHFGLMWTQDGLDRRKLSWGTTEMILHALEDIITHCLIYGQSFAKAPQQQQQQQQREGSRTTTPPEPTVVPQQAVTATQSLKPYARSLSHELRTPMHGVVGMLDVMHATVQEQIEAQANPKVRQVFQTLKENIETVQDSSKRAVEAADNVVHAYDMNMQLPDTPLHDSESPATAVSATTTTYFDYKPSRLIEGSNISTNPHKRRRSTDNWHFGNATKVRHVQPSSRREVSPHSRRSPPTVSPRQPPPPSFLRTPDSLGRPDPPESASRLSGDSEPIQTPGLRQSAIRQIIPVVIHDSLRVGGRPDSAISEPTDVGERIEVRTRSSNGETSQKIIEWSVYDDVPETLLVDERDLGKLISAVFLNAVKFTEEGIISLTVKLSKSRKFLVISVADNGDGMPEDFQPELFKAFSREDDSTTRSKEGLGLGLLVAKGLARRIGGDLTLIHSAVSGPKKGSEFEIRVPLEPGTTISRTNTPLSHTPEPVPPPSSRPTTSATPQTSSSIMALSTADVSSPLRPTSPAKENSRNPTVSKLANDSGPSSAPPPRRTSTANTTSKLPSNASASSLSTPSLVSMESYDRNLASKYPLTFLVAEDNKINRRLLVSMLGKLGYKDVYEAFDGREAVRIMADLVEGQTRNGRRKSEGGIVRGGERLDGSWEGMRKGVDVVLMDLWMPEMDGYKATEEILQMFKVHHSSSSRRGSMNGSAGEGRRHSNAGLAVNGGGGGGDPSVSGAGVRTPKILAVSADVTDEAIEKATRTGMEGFMTKPYRIADLQRLIVEFCVR